MCYSQFHASKAFEYLEWEDDEANINATTTNLKFIKTVPVVTLIQWHDIIMIPSHKSQETP